MKQKMILIVLVIGMVTIPSNAFSQESVQYFASITHQINSCPVTHITSSRMYVPITVKIFHDPTSDFLVHTNSTNIGSLVNSGSYDPTGNSYLITTNSTDQFTFQILATYRDNVEHEIFIEYWSQNENMGIEQLETVGGKFCRNVLVDTSVPPVQPDIGKTIQNAEADKFAQIVHTITNSTNSMGALALASVAGNIIALIVFTGFLIKNRNQGESNAMMKKRMETSLSKSNEVIQNMQVVARQLIVNDKSRDSMIEKYRKEDESKIKSFFNIASMELRSWMVDIQKQVAPEMKIEEKPITIPEDVKLQETEPEKKESGLKNIFDGKIFKKDKQLETFDELRKEYDKVKDTNELRNLHERLRMKLAEDRNNEDIILRMKVLADIIVLRDV